jgi:transposase
MDAARADARRERGKALAMGKAKGIRHIAGTSYLVPSQTSTAGYVVDVAAGRCTCPDFEERGGTCKHQWALRYFRQEVTLPDGTSVVTESVRISYPQNWRAYNRAQCEEKERVQILLGALCSGISEPPRKATGRKPLPMRDAVYCAAMKVYGTMSGRRTTTDLRRCETDGHVTKAPAYNSVFRTIEKPELLPLLRSLVDESAKPLAAVERAFAADATGFTTQTYLRWFDYKHGEDRRSHRWIKCHAMVGTLTNVVTAVEVTEGHVADSPMFTGLVERTVANGFQVREVSADKAYLSHANLAAVERVGAAPFVPFKSNSAAGGSPAWEKLWHLFSLHRETFLTHYHQRSNVESTFSAIKRKFGAGVRSKLPAAQYNEVLLKCLCHNLSMLVHAIHELGVDPKFWLPQQNVTADGEVLP